MIAAFADLSLTDAIIIAGVLAFVAERVAEALGWVRPANALRIENKDLIRINGQLKETIDGHTKALAEQASVIHELRGQISVLKERDQASVLAALSSAQDAAVGRYDALILHQEATTAVLVEIRNLLRNGKGA